MKFFRKIRQHLLSEHKFTKYLLYAVGEIILVVIGILIALQINNRSEFKKIRKQEVSLLSNLANEIQLDILQLENNANSTTERLERLKAIIQSLESAQNIDKSQFIQQSFEFVFDNYFTSNSGIFDEAVSSGRMSYVENERLRQDIFDYYRNASQDYNDDTTRQVTDQLITPIFAETLFLNPEGFSTLGLNVENISSLESIDLEALTKNKSFWKMVLLKFGSNREQIERWQEIKMLAQKLAQEIDQELQNLE